LEEFRRPYWGYIVLIVLVVCVLILGAIAYQLQLPEAVPKPIDGYYDYRPAIAISSSYRISYHIPNPVNVSQTQALSVLFNVTNLVMQTQSAEVHSLNVTIVSAGGAVLFTNTLKEDVILKAGESWGPKQIEFVIDNRTLQVGPGSHVLAKVLISVVFDEIAVFPFPAHSQKTAAVPQQEIVIRSPYALPVRETYVFSLRETLVTCILVGGLVYSMYGIRNVILNLPRPDPSLPSGWRSPKTGRAVRRWSANKAILSIVVGLVFVTLANLGMSTHQIDLMKLVSDFFLGKPDIQVLVGTCAWISGILLNHFPRGQQELS